jgi:hypothetical protein
VVSGASTDFNPTLSAAAIEAERLSDPAAAVSEWFGGLRVPIASQISSLGSSIFACLP